jgi:hypothetical protein
VSWLKSLRTQIKEKSKRKPEHILMDAIGFTEEDLEFNLEGDLSDAQEAWLNGERSLWMYRIVLALVVFGAACIFILINLDGATEYQIIIGFCIFTGMFVFASISKWMQFNGDLRDGIEVAEGRIKLDIRDKAQEHSKYRIIIENITFKIDKDIFLAFKNGDPYAIYYAPHTKTILSAVWLR